jgi:uncharacterized membrane protein YkvI
MESRNEAFTAGLLAGAIGMIPGIMILVCMAGDFANVMATNAAGAFLHDVPINATLKAINMKWFEVVFQIVLLGTFIETGTGFVKAATDRLEGQFCKKDNPRKWIRPLAVVVAMILGIVISQFGLTALVARGYGTVSWAIFIVYAIPLITIGIYRIVKHGPTPDKDTNEVPIGL